MGYNFVWIPMVLTLRRAKGLVLHVEAPIISLLFHSGKEMNCRFYRGCNFGWLYQRSKVIPCMHAPCGGLYAYGAWYYMAMLNNSATMQEYMHDIISHVYRTGEFKAMPHIYTYDLNLYRSKNSYFNSCK